MLIISMLRNHIYMVTGIVLLLYNFQFLLLLLQYMLFQWACYQTIHKFLFSILGQSYDPSSFFRLSFSVPWMWIPEIYTQRLIYEYHPNSGLVSHRLTWLSSWLKMVCRMSVVEWGIHLWRGWTKIINSLYILCLYYI